MCRDEKDGPTFEEMIKGYIHYRTKLEEQYATQQSVAKQNIKSSLTSFYDELLTKREPD